MNTDSILYKHIITKASGKAYRYRPVMVSLLSKVTGVEEATILNTKLYSRSTVRYIPFYSAQKGGGAITLGNSHWHSITFTENFFSEDTEYYGRKAYAHNPRTWLRLSAHEVGHLHHTLRFKSFFIYLIVFAYQYLKYGHDAAPLEIEAEQGPRMLSRFSSYMKSDHGVDLIHDCIATDMDESEKLSMLKKLWDGFSLSDNV